MSFARKFGSPSNWSGFSRLLLELTGLAHVPGEHGSRDSAIAGSASESLAGSSPAVPTSTAAEASTAPTTPDHQGTNEHSPPSADTVSPLLEQPDDKPAAGKRVRHERTAASAAKKKIKHFSTRRAGAYEETLSDWETELILLNDQLEEGNAMNPTELMRIKLLETKVVEGQNGAGTAAQKAAAKMKNTQTKRAAAKPEARRNATVIDLSEDPTPPRSDTAAAKAAPRRRTKKTASLLSAAVSSNLPAPARRPSPPAIQPTRAPAPSLYEIPAFAAGSAQDGGLWLSGELIALSNTIFESVDWDKFARERGRSQADVMNMFSATVQLPMYQLDFEGIRKADAARKRMDDLQKEAARTP